MTSDRNRRVFMLHAIAGTGAVLVTHGAAHAQAKAPAADKAAVPDKPTADKAAPGAPPENAPVSNDPVKETDPYPKSMGFRVNTANVDKTKFPRHEATQKCHSCQLFSGKDGEALGPCSFFKRMVPPDGWCRNFKPKKVA